MSRRISPSPRGTSDRKRPARDGAAEGAAATAPGTKSARLSTAMAVLQQFRELFRVSQQHFQRIESHCGVSGAQLWALSEVSAVPGITVSQLARAMSIHLSTSSNLLDKLEVQGFVRRERGSIDQRTVHVHLTRAGQRVLRKAPRPVEGVIPDALAKLPAQALHNLRRDLGALLDLASVRNPKAARRPLAEP
jgi:DNA-binding MarR family transcriptional regulator